MYYIKNISVESVTLGGLGVVIAPGETRSYNDIGTIETISQFQSTLNDLVLQEKIVILNDALEEFTTAESSEIINNASSVSSLDELISINPSLAENYYFLKDSFKLGKYEIITKRFRGRVNSLHLTPLTNKCQVTIISGEGIVMPIDELVKRQTLEFNFDGKIEDIEIVIESLNYSVEIDVFIEGHSRLDKLDTLQDFIDTWYEDLSVWKTPNIITVKDSIKEKAWKNIIKTNEAAGNIIEINAPKIVGVNKEFEIYVDGNETIIEYLEWDVDGAWNPRKFYTVFKNVKYVTFTDGTIEVPISNPIDWRDRKLDGRHY